MNPLIPVFCVSLSAHAAQSPYRSPQLIAPALPSFLAAPPAPERRASSGPAFADYFHAEAEFLAADERFQEAPEGSALRQDAAEARGIAFERAERLLQQIGRREEVSPESWEDFALASESMRRESAPESLASGLFNVAEITGWLGFRVSALGKLRKHGVFELARAAELFDRQAAGWARDSHRRAAYEDVATETWTRAYLLLDERLEGFLPNDYISAEQLADKFGRLLHQPGLSPRLQDFYTRARREAWSATRLGLIERLLSANADDLRTFRDKYVRELRGTRLNSAEYVHCQRILADIGGVLSDQPGTRQRWLGLLRWARLRGLEHFHPRDEALERGGRP